MKFFQIKTQNKFLPTKTTTLYREFEAANKEKYVSFKVGQGKWKNTKYNNLKELLPEIEKTEIILKVEEWNRPLRRVITKKAEIKDILN